MAPHLSYVIRAYEPGDESTSRFWTDATRRGACSAGWSCCSFRDDVESYNQISLLFSRPMSRDNRMPQYVAHVTGCQHGLDVGLGRVIQ